MPRRNSNAGGLNRNVRKHRKWGRTDVNVKAPLSNFSMHPPKRPAR